MRPTYPLISLFPSSCRIRTDTPEDFAAKTVTIASAQWSRTRAPNSPDLGKARFLANFYLIDRVIRFHCHRSHLNPDQADEFAGHVRLKLIEDNYAVLAKFQGRSTLRTFLAVVIKRLLSPLPHQPVGKMAPVGGSSACGANRSSARNAAHARWADVRRGLRVPYNRPRNFGHACRSGEAGSAATGKGWQAFRVS